MLNYPFPVVVLLCPEPYQPLLCPEQHQNHLKIFGLFKSKPFYKYMVKLFTKFTDKIKFFHVDVQCFPTISPFRVCFYTLKLDKVGLFGMCLTEFVWTVCGFARLNLSFNNFKE